MVRYHLLGRKVRPKKKRDYNLHNHDHNNSHTNLYSLYVYVRGYVYCIWRCWCTWALSRHSNGYTAVALSSACDTHATSLSKWSLRSTWGESFLMLLLVSRAANYRTLGRACKQILAKTSNACAKLSRDTFQAWRAITADSYHSRQIGSSFC